MNYIIGICDDEILQIKVNGLYIKEIAKKNKFEVDIKGFESSRKLFHFLSENELDILFLDIDLGVDSGIEIATKLASLYPNIIVIFVTGHREFANEAFDVEAMGYVVKPVEALKMERVLKKAILQVTAIKNQKPVSTLVITEENLKKKINQAEIIYIERLQTKSIIHTKNKVYKVYEPITSLCKRLNQDFLRVNQSEIVNIHEIKEIKDNLVYLKNNISMSIGRTFRKSVIDTYLGTP
ncbi:MAG: Response regulator of the LytR/AlgR family [Anaerocolumna sp.]|jgi:DNA-binding LytR/AlgR family response regulator|nr:Response regulator of the LytR/AlgR family [Anaerocolumna sp.]